MHPSFKQLLGGKEGQVRRLELPQLRLSLEDTYLSKIQKLENQDGTASFFKVSRFPLNPETIPIAGFLEHLQTKPHPHLLTPEAFNAEEQQPLVEFYPLVNAVTMDQAKHSLKKSIIEGNVNGNDIMDMMQQLTSALAYIHQLGFVHRDVRMENVFLQPKQDKLHLTLFDYNSLRRPFFQQAGVASWNSGMPPELGEGGVMVDATFDTYAVGHIFYMLTHQFGNELPVSSLDPNHPIFDIIQKARLSQSERYQNASDMYTDIMMFI